MWGKKTVTANFKDAAVPAPPKPIQRAGGSFSRGGVSRKPTMIRVPSISAKCEFLVCELVLVRCIVVLSAAFIALEHVLPFPYIYLHVCVCVCVCVFVCVCVCVWVG